MRVIHNIEPVYDKNTKVLILGSIPSIKSREIGFYYAHPRNRFWMVLSCIFEEDIKEDVDSKIKFLKRHGIGLFDVIKSCEIDASSDSSIKNPICNNLQPILDVCDIRAIFTTGRKAYQLYMKYCYPVTGIEAIYLPSTSGANNHKGIMDELKLAYAKIREFLD